MAFVYGAEYDFLNAGPLNQMYQLNAPCVEEWTQSEVA